MDNFIFNRYAKYKIGFDQSGILLGIIVNFYCDSGNSPNGNKVCYGLIWMNFYLNRIIYKIFRQRHGCGSTLCR